MRAWIRSAPGTYAWLAAVGATTLVLRQLPAAHRDDVLASASTNLANLSTVPVRTMAASAVFTDSVCWTQCALLFTGIHAPVERWLGTRRWSAVALVGHIGGTLLSQAMVWHAIRRRQASPSMADAVDVGVSYGVAAAAGVLAHRIPEPWRLPYLAAMLAGTGVPLVAKRTFTDLGHFSALSLGIGCGYLMPGQAH